MKRWQQIAFGLTAYLLWIVATAPATLVDAGLQRLSQNRLRLVEAQGTVWTGSGWIEMRDSAGRAGFTRSVSWRILAESLLRGQLVGEVRLEEAARPFPVILSFGGVDIANAEIGLPATVIGLGVPKLAPLGLTGDLQFHVGRLSIGRSTMQGDVAVHWRNAGSLLTPIAPLGDYELKLDIDSTTVAARLQTVRGPLQLDGLGAWPIERTPDFVVNARVLPEHLQQLGPLLRLISVERGVGTFEMSLR